LATLFEVEEKVLEAVSLQAACRPVAAVAR